MRKYTGDVLQSMLSFTIVLFAHCSNYSFCRKRFLSLVFGAFLLDLLCCHTTLSANQRLTAGSYTAEFDYDVVGTLAAARYNETSRNRKGLMQIFFFILLLNRIGNRIELPKRIYCH